MNNTLISRQEHSDAIKLDYQNYTLSLLKEGYKNGRLTSQEVERCHYEIMLLVKKLIQKYTGGASSSVKIELAQTFLSSILFSLDAWLIHINNPRESWQLIKEGAVQEIYLQGLDYLELYFCKIKTLFAEAKRNQLEIDNTAYQVTMNQALPDFIDHYDIIFNAHDHKADIDYPLLFDTMDTVGIHYIKQYIDTLTIETEFCRCFSHKQLNQLLSSYGRTYRINYREALLNVFEITLTNAIFSALNGQKAGVLALSDLHVKTMQFRLSALDDDGLDRVIQKATDQVIGQLDIQRPELKTYIYKYIDTLLPRLKSALKHRHLKNIAIIDVKKETTPDIIFDLGHKMNDSDFRCLVENILGCENSKQRIDLIFNNVRSLGDFVDVLEADCLFEGDWNRLYRKLGDIELSILGRIIYIEEIRSDPQGFTLPRNDQAKDFLIWQNQFNNYVKTLNKNRLKSINKHMQLSIQSQYTE